MCHEKKQQFVYIETSVLGLFFRGRLAKKGKEDLIFSLILIVPAFISQQIGTKIRDKINHKQFRNLVLFTLIILGISLFLKTI